MQSPFIVVVHECDDNDDEMRKLKIFHHHLYMLPTTVVHLDAEEQSATTHSYSPHRAKSANGSA